MTDSPTPESDPIPNSREGKNFGMKSLFAILFAVGITILIVIFRDQLRELEKLAYGGAFLIMLISNATVILPVPGLVVVYSLGSTLNPLLVGLFAGPGAALGELTGYAAGYGGSAVIDDMKLYRTIKKWMDRYGAIVITLLASFPNPVFDMVGIVAGSVRMKWWRFLIAVWIGKTIQCILIAYAGYLSLGWIQNFMTQ
jgi:membrane protein YqaA with SNARE-associated domain